MATLTSPHLIEEMQKELQDLERNTYENLRLEHIKNMWESLGKLKVFSHKFKYHTAWTYQDVLDYFKKNGFPKPAKSVTDSLMENMNVCKARHILRNDCLCEESVLLALLEMYERKKEVEKIKEDKKFWQGFLTVFSFVLSIAMAFIPGGQGVAVWLQVMSYIGIATSIASGIVGIVDMVLDNQNEAKIQDINKKTQDLLLKNMPKSGNYVDTSITNPYAMYANGRYWKEGGAGMERYDQIKPHQPYNALDDKFKDSDMYDILNYKLNKNAGGDEYFSNLYPDAKWTSPNTIKILLNSQTQTYLPMRIKTVEALFKWLTQEDLGTYYLKEKNPEDDDKYWDRYSNVEFEDMEAVLGFTSLVQYYDVTKSVYYLGYETSVSTTWDKTEDNKTQKQTHNITDNSHIKFVKKAREVLKGSDVRLQWIQFSRFNGGNNPYDFLSTDKTAHYFATWQVKEAYCDSTKYYECEYELYTYGNKEVYFYNFVYEIINYKEGMNEKDFVYGEKLNLSKANAKIYNPTQYIWEVRGQLDNVSLRFRSRTLTLGYSNTMFLEEEVTKVSRPYVIDFTKKEYVFENIRQIPTNTSLQIFLNYDKKTQFGFIQGFGVFSTQQAIAQNTQKQFIKTTMYHNSKDKQWTTYFGINAFLNPKINITIL